MSRSTTPPIRLRHDPRNRRRTVQLEESLASGARHALVLAYLGFVALPLLAPIVAILALRVRREIRRTGIGEAWLGTTTAALLISFGQAVLFGIGMVIYLLWLA